jgi:hypothetical protein
MSKVIHAQASLLKVGPVGRISEGVNPNIPEVLILRKPFPRPEETWSLMQPPCPIRASVEPVDKDDVKQGFLGFIHAVKAVWAILVMKPSKGATSIRGSSRRPIEGTRVR